MSNEAIKVKVKSYTHPNAWYKNEIGNEFEVTDDGSGYWQIVGKTNLNRNAFILKSDCEVIPTTHPQGEPKTNEDILKQFFIEYETDMVIDDKAMSIFMASDESKMAIKIMQAARASERAQIIAEQKIEIPQCLQECRFKNEEMTRLILNWNGSAAKLVSMTEGIMLEKFSLLLSQVKGLPTIEETKMFFAEMGYALTDKQLTATKNFYAMCFFERDEAHKAEAEAAFNAGRAQIECKALSDSNYQDSNGGCNCSDGCKEYQFESFEHYRNKIYLFLKEKEGQN